MLAGSNFGFASLVGQLYSYYLVGFFIPPSTYVGQTRLIDADYNLS